MRFSRKTRIAKWTCTLVCVLIGGIALASYWYLFEFWSKRFPYISCVSCDSCEVLVAIKTEDPQLGYSHYALRVEPGVSCWPKPPGYCRWRFRLPFRGDVSHVIIDDPIGTFEQTLHRTYGFPLWIPLGLLAIPTALLWRRDRRVPPGFCRRCRYDLTGNTSGVCSECGLAASVSRTQASDSVAHLR